MNAPDFDRVYETFIPLSEKALYDWNAYLDDLRKLDWLIRTLRLRHIGWWSFLVHDCFSGVPEGVQGLYIHVRMELLPDVSLEHLLEKLPSYCVMTQKMKTPPAAELSKMGLDTADVSALWDYSSGWALIGESSEWALHFVTIHKGYVPPDNFAQFIHYLDNQLLGCMLTHELTDRLIKSRIFRLLNYAWKRICS